MLAEDNLLQNELIVDSLAQVHLKETAMWAKFLGIMGFIFSGMVALVAIFANTVFSKFTTQLQASGQSAMVIGVIMVMYLIIAVILFIMSLYLYRFATRMQLALRGNDQESLVLSFRNLKVYYRFAGIITIIYIGLLVLLLAGGVIAAMAVHQ